jgi:hypothetical protein
MTPYQFAILRYQHSASAGELVNVGIVMWLPSEGKIWHKLNDRYGRLSKFFPQFDGSRYREMMRRIDLHFSLASAREQQLTLFSKHFTDLNIFLSHPIRRDDSCFQWSEIMAGIADKPAERLTELFVEFVTQYEESIQRERRDEENIWQAVDAKLQQTGLSSRIERDVSIQGKFYSYEFKTGWKNGIAQGLEPISFDLVRVQTIIDKANTWSGRLLNLQNGRRFQLTGIVSRPAGDELSEAYSRALRILGAAPSVRDLIPENELDRAVRLIEHDLIQTD